MGPLAVIAVLMLVGFAAGAITARWGAVVCTLGALAILGIVGLPLGWFNSYDMEPLGGLIILAISFGFPFLLAMAAGVAVARAVRNRAPG